MSNAMMMPGGGLSGGKLTLADADVGDVVAGKKFYAGDKVIKTGTLELSGDAAAGQVKSGCTFYNSDPKNKVTGTWVPRLKLLTSGSWSGDATRSLSVSGYSIYYFVFDDYENSDCANKGKSQGSWGLVLNGGGLTIAECYGCNPNSNTTFSITYYHTGGYGRSARVYAIA